MSKDARIIGDEHLVDAEGRPISEAERIKAENDLRTPDAGVTEKKVLMNDPDNIDRSEVKHMSKESKSDLNADMITGEPGSHPIGTGIGGVGGAAAGAAIGSMAGPLGTLIGGAIGAVAGGSAGHASAEAMNPTHEEAYWRAEFANTDFHAKGHDFDRDVHPAYAVGYANRVHYPADARFEDHEADLERSWNEVKGESSLQWDEARMAAKNAWNRVG